MTGAREQVTVSDFPDEETGLERAATRSRPRSRRGMEATSESAPIPSSAGCPFSAVSQPCHVDLKTQRLGEAKQKGLAELWGPRREASALRGSHVLKLLWLGVGWAVSRRGGRRGASRGAGLQIRKMSPFQTTLLAVVPLARRHSLPSTPTPSPRSPLYSSFKPGLDAAPSRKPTFMPSHLSPI